MFWSPDWLHSVRSKARPLALQVIYHLQEGLQVDQYFNCVGTFGSNTYSQEKMDTPEFTFDRLY